MNSIGGVMRAARLGIRNAAKQLWRLVPKTVKLLRRRIRSMGKLARGVNLAVAFLASLVTLLTIVTLGDEIQRSANNISQFVRGDDYWTDVINSLDTGVDASQFAAKLNTQPARYPAYLLKAKGYEKSNGYENQIFRKEKFGVTALVGPKNRVMYYAVTLLDARYEPYIKKAGVTLGRSTFADIPNQSHTASAGISTSPEQDHMHYYYEELYVRTNGNDGTHMEVFIKSDIDAAQGFTPKAYIKYSRSMDLVVANYCAAESGDIAARQAEIIKSAKQKIPRSRAEIGTVGFKASDLDVCDFLAEADDGGQFFNYLFAPLHKKQLKS